MEVSTTKAFSNGVDSVTAKLVDESRGPSLLAWGDALFVGHGEHPVTLQHSYPDVLPRDAEITQAVMSADFISWTTAVELDAKVSELGTYFSSVFAASGSNSGSVTISNAMNISRAVVFLEYRMAEGQPIQTFNDCFEGRTYNLNELTDSPDLLNLTFRTKATTYDPFNENATMPAPGVQFRARCKAVLRPSYEEVTYYLTPWFETDKQGEVEIAVGSGGAVIETVRDAYVAPPFAALTVVGDGVGYGECRMRIEDLYGFKGKLKIQVKDPLGRPVSGARLELQGIVSAFEYSDSAGELEVEVNGGGTDTRTE